MAAVLLSFLISGLMAGCVTPVLLPSAAFTVSPATGTSPLTVTCDASASVAPDGTIVAYSWDFGDGSAGQGMITGHSYVADVEQTFTITLQVTDYDGQQATTTHTVSVEPAPEDVQQQDTIAFVWPFHYDASGDDAANLNDEYFTLENTGDQTMDLSDWTVENERGTTFVIPSGVTLSPGAVLYIHSGSGVDSPGILYWGASEPVWKNTSDLAVLRDKDGAIIDVYPYASCSDTLSAR